jgi:hypothetical protein
MSEALTRFTGDLLQNLGALVEGEEAGTRVLLPAGLAKQLGVEEWTHLSFGPRPAADGVCLTLDSDWLEKCEGVLADHGKYWRVTLDLLDSFPKDPEALAANKLALRNATFRFLGVKPAWTRLLICTVEYSARSGDQREGLIDFALNLATQSTLEAVASSYIGLLGRGRMPEPATPPEPEELPALLSVDALRRVLTRALPPRVQECLGPFVERMQRQLRRDAARLNDYHGRLEQEAISRLEAARHGERGLTQEAQRREEKRIEAVARERQAKLDDLRQHYAVNVEMRPLQILEVWSRVLRFELRVLRRKRDRIVALDYHPVARKLESWPCEWRWSPETGRVVCDERLHIVASRGHGDCDQCGRSFCRACHHRCPKCGSG